MPYSPYVIAQGLAVLELSLAQVAPQASVPPPAVSGLGYFAGDVGGRVHVHAHVGELLAAAARQARPLSRPHLQVY